MDHKYINDARSNIESFEIVIIYEVLDAKITSVLAVRESKE
ncbi:MAG: hypothetical protein ACI9DK_001886 [Vicingaceae bacterium]|jgi:hypothetical protein